MADALTGLPTHQELGRVLNGNTPLALLVDTDSLLWLNDQFGHVAGDRALAAVAAALKGCSAGVDRSAVFRVGGDEFLVVLPSAALEVALRLAADVVHQVRALDIPYRRLDRPEQTRLEVNVVVLRLTADMVSKGLLVAGLAASLKAWAGQLVFERKQQGHGQPGVVVDAHALRWDPT